MVRSNVLHDMKEMLDSFEILKVEVESSIENKLNLWGDIEVELV